MQAHSRFPPKKNAGWSQVSHVHKLCWMVKLGAMPERVIWEIEQADPVKKIIDLKLNTEYFRSLKASLI